MAICMIIVASVETQTPTLANGAKSESVGISIVFLLFLFIFFCKDIPLCPSVHMANNAVRQTILGCHSLDLDLRNLLNERPSTSSWNVLSDAERRKRDCEPGEFLQT